jgi:pectate lyase
MLIALERTIMRRLLFYVLSSQVVVLAIVLLGTASAEPNDMPAFPGAEGFGAFTPGGRGGKVFLVTNLNDSGPGSLRAACKAEGPRIVVFRVSGIIELQSKLSIKNPYITIAGQSAPGDGICLKNYPCYIATHDVIVRHLRFRPGDVARKEMDSLTIVDGQNIIIDHCSASWGTDETLSVTRDSKNVTVQWCMISESLNESVHHKGAHGYGSLISGYDGGVTFHHNVYAHHNSRNPRPGGYEDKPGIILDFRNNLIYNWGSAAGYNGENRLRMNYVGNYLKPGPSTRESKREFAFNVGGPLTELFVADNYLEGFPEKNRDNWLMIRPPRELTEDAQGIIRASVPFPVAPVETEAPQVAYQRILESVGATLPTRDAVDARVIEEIRTGGGKIINSQAEVGGWPEYKQEQAPDDADLDGMPDEWERKYGLDPADALDNSKDKDSDGYTNIEEFLNGTDPRK